MALGLPHQRHEDTYSEPVYSSGDDGSGCGAVAVDRYPVDAEHDYDRSWEEVHHQRIVDYNQFRVRRGGYHNDHHQSKQHYQSKEEAWPRGERTEPRQQFFFHHYHNPLKTTSAAFTLSRNNRRWEMAEDPPSRNKAVLFPAF